MSETITATTIADADEWDALRPEWDVLVRESGCRTVAWEFSWLREWWRVYAESGAISGARLQVVVFRRGSRLAGVLPLYERRLGSLAGVRELRFLSTGESEFEETCADGMDLISVPADAAECAASAVEVLAQARWDVLSLERVPSSSALVAAIPGDGSGWPRPSVQADVCQFADLTNGFDSYLASLPSNARSKARQLIRHGDNAGVSLSLATAETVDAFFDELVGLHQERWTSAGERGAFSAARFLAFHRGIARRWVPQGRAVIARAAIGDLPISMIYGFIADRKFEYYQSGSLRRPVGPIFSPGVLGNLVLARELARRGIRKYDFMAGNAAYKRRLSNGSEGIASLGWERRSFGTGVWQMESLAQRVIARLRRASSRARASARDGEPE